VSVREVVAAYFERLNAERWSDLLDLFHEDAELAAPGGRPRRGRAAIEAYYRAALAPYPEHLDAPGRVLVDGDAAAVEIRFTGRLATGAPLAFDAVDVFDVREGRIARLTSWYDSHGVRRALAEALALEPPAGGAGGVAEATPARARAALALVRRGEALRLDPPGDGGPRSAALVARAVLVDAGALPGDEPRAIGPAELEVAAEEQGVALRPGDALLVRTGRPGSAPGLAPGAATAGWVRERRLSAVATDGPLDAARLGATGAAVWERWRLEDLAADCAATGIWDGLLVAVPPGGAVVLR
jgi:ketosteroid isomerase-like protein